jgi:hypothetical protein
MFTYTISDSKGGTDVGIVTVQVSAFNATPIAFDDWYGIEKNRTLTMGAAGTLANDCDADGDVMTAVKMSDPAHGALTLNTNGSFVYTPDADWSGTDWFEYVARDSRGACSQSAVVTIDVSAGPGVDAWGIPDAWKIQYFGATTGPNTGALEDWDRDGMNNYGEWRAGTIPTNAASRLQVTGFRCQGATDVVIQWSSVVGKQYRIQGTTNMLLGFPEAVSNHIPATAGTNSCTLPVGQETRKYYRVMLEP